MLETRSLILLIFGGSLLVLAVWKLRQFRLRERYAVLFLIIGMPFLVLAWWPTGILWLSGHLKIDPNTFMLLCVSIFLILAVFELLAIVSQQDRKITTLAQMVGILMQKQGQQDRQPDAAPPPANQTAQPGQSS